MADADRMHSCNAWLKIFDSKYYSFKVSVAISDAAPVQRAENWLFSILCYVRVNVEEIGKTYV